MNLHDWAMRHGVSKMALTELLAELASNDAAPPVADPSNLASEALVQSRIRLEAPRFGVWLTRNNVGGYMADNGQFVRYGLANESTAQNRVIKSGDLIGFRKRVISPADVGTVIAQFVSRECKKEGWTKPSNARERAQANWRDFVNANGGDAAIASGPGSFINR